MSRYVVRVVQRDGVARYLGEQGGLYDMTEYAAHWKILTHAHHAVDTVRTEWPDVIVDVIDIDDPETTVEQP